MAELNKRNVGGMDYYSGVDPVVAVGPTPWYLFGPGVVIVALGSAANGPTAVTATVQRSATDPNDPVNGATPVNASATTVTGNPSAGGTNALPLTESGIGWWRLNVTAFTAGAVGGVSALTGRVA